MITIIKHDRKSLLWEMWYFNGFGQRVAKQQLFKQGPTSNNKEAVFSVDPTDAPIVWLDSYHVGYVYCRSKSVPRLYK
jgi:hypothetical protein